jgi:hypothetical protein
MEKDEVIDSDDQATKLDMWAASLLAHRETEDGYQVGHNAVNQSRFRGGSRGDRS